MKENDGYIRMNLDIKKEHAILFLQGILCVCAILYMVHTNNFRPLGAFQIFLIERLNIGYAAAHHLAYNIQLLIVAVSVVYFVSSLLKHVFTKVSFYIFLAGASVVFHAIVIYNIPISGAGFFEIALSMPLFSALFILNMLFSASICIFLYLLVRNVI